MSGFLGSWIFIPTETQVPLSVQWDLMEDLQVMMLVM